MNRKTDRKLIISKDTLRKLPDDGLKGVAGGAYTDRPRCRLSQPMSFCVCATKAGCF